MAPQGVETDSRNQAGDKSELSSPTCCQRDDTVAGGPWDGQEK